MTAGQLRLDARGLRCPLPVIRVGAAARQASPGTVITVLSTDPAAEPDLAAWCRMRGHDLLDQEWLPDEQFEPGGRSLRSRIRIRPPAGQQQGPAGRSG